MQIQNYDITGAVAKWWDNSNDGTSLMGGHKLCRKDRQRRRGGGIAFYVKEQSEHVELFGIGNRLDEDL